MECPSCHETTSGIIEEASLWCDKCGNRIRDNYEFVTGFNNKHSAPRQQVYCRAKRFTKYIQTKCNVPEVKLHIYDIVDVYSALEFTWCCHRALSERIYFFAKPVMLKFCCAVLQLPLHDGLPALKDKSREETQYQDLMALADTPTFRARRW